MSLIDNFFGIFEKRCDFCGKLSKSGYYKTHAYFPTFRFCKISCLNKFIRDTISKNCFQCGYKFKATDINNDRFILDKSKPRKVFCSQDCFYKVN